MADGDAISMRCVDGMIEVRTAVEPGPVTDVNWVRYRFSADRLESVDAGWDDAVRVDQVPRGVQCGSLPTSW